MECNWTTYLEDYRKERNFSPEKYIAEKTRLLTRYLREKEITNVTIGISGGVDSVLSCAILKELVDKEVLEKYTPIVVYSNIGGSNQNTIADYARTGIKWLNKTPHYIDLTDSVADVISQCDVIDELGQGQVLPILRTAVISSYCYTRGYLNHRTVTAGTINKDEGSYIGFYGKQSDGAVDLQLISDIHKSEVLSTLRYLNAPEDIVNRTPRGDVVYDIDDVDLIGAPYDFVEFFTGKYLEDTNCQRNLKETKETISWEKALNLKHYLNRHKYESGMTGLHFDIYNRYVKGGWSDTNTQNYK